MHLNRLYQQGNNERKHETPGIITPSEWYLTNPLSPVYFSYSWESEHLKSILKHNLIQLLSRQLQMESTVQMELAIMFEWCQFRTCLMHWKICGETWGWLVPNLVGTRHKTYYQCDKDYGLTKEASTVVAQVNKCPKALLFSSFKEHKYD